MKIHMTITRPEIEEDFHLVFRDKQYPVSKCLFGLYSKRFRNSREFGSEKTITVDDDVSDNSFQTFVNACQSRFYTINDSNCFDLLTLCTQWEVESIKKEVTKYLEKIGSIESAVIKLTKADNHELESFISRNLNKAMKYPSFLSLPSEVLTRILKQADPKEVDHHLLLTTLLHLHEKNGDSASCLFDFLDTAALTRDELKQLISAPGIDQASMRMSLVKTMDELFRRMDEHKEAVKEFAERNPQEKQEKTLSKLSHEVKHLKSKFAKEMQSGQKETVHPDVVGKIDQFTKHIHDLEEKVSEYKQMIDKMQSRAGEIEDIASDVMQQFTSLQKSVQEANEKPPKPKRTSVREVAMETEQKKNRSTTKAPDSGYRIPMSQSNSALAKKTEVKRKHRQTVMVVQKDLPIRGSVISKPYTNDAFDGVLSFLANQCGNPCEAGLIAITSSSKTGQDPSIVATPNAWGWRSEDKHQQWIMFDFKAMVLRATNYTLQSTPYKAGSDHPKSWALEVSDSLGDDGWKVIDQQNSGDLNGPGSQKTYACACDKPYQFYRIRATGPNHKGTASLAIARVEFFGTLSLAALV